MILTPIKIFIYIAIPIDNVTALSPVLNMTNEAIAMMFSNGNGGTGNKFGENGTQTSSGTGSPNTNTDIKPDVGNSTQGSANNVFKNDTAFNEHYIKHGNEIKNALGKNTYSATDYLDDANYIIQNGSFSPELNGYVEFIGGNKYGFVGLDRTTKQITTFHIKTVSELTKKAPSLGILK